MFKTVVIISIIFLLSSCGGTTCLTAPGLLKDEIRDIIPTKPSNFGDEDFDKNKIASYWVKSDLKLKENGTQKVRITSNGINLCYDAVQDATVEPGGPEEKSGKNILQLRYSAAAHEKLIFRLELSIIGSFSEDVCDNKKDNVYVQDPSACKKDNLKTEYSAKISNGDGPFTNRYYANKADSAKWLNGKTHVLLNKVDSDGKPIPDSSIKRLNELTKFKLPCDLDGFVRSKCGEKDSECIEGIKSTIFNNNTYLLNSMCGNICGIKDANGKINWSNCAQTEISIEHSKGIETESAEIDQDGNITSWIKKKELTYIPSLKVDMYNSSKPDIKIPLPVHSSINQGIRSGYGYEIPSRYLPPDVVDKLFFYLGKSKNEDQQSGGYHISVEKDCSYYTSQSLYYYVGNESPDGMPGQVGNLIDLNKGDESDHFEIKGTGDVYYGVRDNGDGYENNIGYFETLTFVEKDVPETISWLVNRTKKYIFKAFYGPSFDVNNPNNNLSGGAVGIVYEGIIKNSSFISLTKVTLLLYVTLYSLFYLLGMFRASQAEMASLIVKISIIIILIGPNSWIFFNTYLFPLFTKAPIELINIMTGQQSSNTDFKFLDLSLYRFALPQTWLQILSLLFTGPVGWIAVFLIFWGLIMLIGCLFEAVMLYFISIIMVALLLSMAPMFIICILFQRTKAIFDSWIKLLAQVAMQPVVVFASIAMLNQAMTGVLYGLFNFDICTACVLQPSIDLKITEIKFCLLEFFLPLGFSPVSTVYDHLHDADNGLISFMGIPIPIINIMMFVILAHAMKSFVQVAGTIASSIFGMMVADLSDVAYSAKESTLGIIGMDSESRMRRLQMKYNQKSHTPSRGISRGSIGSNTNPIDGPIHDPPSSFPDPTDQSQDRQ
ncbi:type IV secretion system protein [Candidatus Mesenet endosymbiont of Agriotes lineatus]|uniref:type IV secretion system protein n=1 Tax=Candidatus Mesenet endosymbiont of Agriotes lineatus TaxID=3077948 RepID=UPI0030D06587